MDLNGEHSQITRPDAEGAPHSALTTPPVGPVQVTLEVCLTPAIAALLTGEPQHSVTVGGGQGRTILTEHIDYPDGTSYSLIVPTDSPALREGHLAD